MSRWNSHLILQQVSTLHMSRERLPVLDHIAEVDRSPSLRYITSLQHTVFLQACMQRKAIFNFKSFTLIVANRCNGVLFSKKTITAEGEGKRFWFGIVRLLNYRH